MFLQLRHAPAYRCSRTFARSLMPYPDADVLEGGWSVGWYRVAHLQALAGAWPGHRLFNHSQFRSGRGVRMVGSAGPSPLRMCHRHRGLVRHDRVEQVWRARGR